MIKRLQRLAVPDEVERYKEEVRKILNPDVERKVLSAYDATESARLTLDPNDSTRTLISRDAYERAKEEIIKNYLTPEEAKIYKDLVYRLEKTTPNIPWKR